jgi:hypothetical protein
VPGGDLGPYLPARAADFNQALAAAEISETDSISTGLGIKAETQVFQIGRFSETSDTAK